MDVANEFIEAIADRVAEKVRDQMAPPPEDEVWLTMKEAGERVRIDYSTIASAVRRRELPSYTPLGRKRINQAELDVWVKKQRN